MLIESNLIGCAAYRSESCFILYALFGIVIYICTSVLLSSVLFALTTTFYGYCFIYFTCNRLRLSTDIDQVKYGGLIVNTIASQATQLYNSS